MTKRLAHHVLKRILHLSAPYSLEVELTNVAPFNSPQASMMKLCLTVTFFLLGCSVSLAQTLVYEGSGGIGEEAQLRAWGSFLRRLHESPEADGTFLDSTMLLLTSNLGNASAHSTKNMPVVFAGGGFNHGQHLVFDRNNNYPLPNLYTSMLQRLGLEIETFASATGTMRGLELS